MISRRLVPTIYVLEEISKLLIFVQNKDFGYTLEPPRWGGCGSSYGCQQSEFGGGGGIGVPLQTLCYLHVYKNGVQGGFLS